MLILHTLLSCMLYVVVILGHSTVTHVKSLRIQDIFTAFVQPKPPSLFIFLGCCGGNPRYGPLKKLSLLPEWQGTVFSFFQRRVYVDEHVIRYLF